MSKLAQENLVVVVVLAVFGAFIAISLTYSAKAALVPVFVASVSCALLLLQLYLQNFRKDIKLSVDAMDIVGRYADPALLAEEEEIAGSKKGSTAKELASFGLVILYLALVMVFGLIESTFLFVLGYFWYFGKYKWYQCLITAVVTAFLLNFLFGSLLGIRMFQGWLGTTFFGG